jgi:hypothetical protein
MIQIGMPHAGSTELLWAQLICVWMLTNYGRTIHHDEKADSHGIFGKKGATQSVVIQTLCAASLAYLLPGVSTVMWKSRVLIAAILATLTWVLIIGRNDARKTNSTLRKVSAEFEVGTNLCAILLMGYIINVTQLQISPEGSVITLNVSTPGLTATFLIAGALIFLNEGGTQLTRAVLDKTGAAPHKPSRTISATKVPKTRKQNKVIDTKEYNRGRYIGSLERTLVFALVLLGRYETIGFVIAGKGLIRAKEFEDRDFAEYFLIGTLTSTFIALAVGLLLRLLLFGTMKG